MLHSAWDDAHSRSANKIEVRPLKKATCAATACVPCLGDFAHWLFGPSAPNAGSFSARASSFRVPPLPGARLYALEFSVFPGIGHIEYPPLFAPALICIQRCDPVLLGNNPAPCVLELASAKPATRDAVDTIPSRAGREKSTFSTWREPSVAVKYALFGLKPA
jgi:hypothetical protein